MKLVGNVYMLSYLVGMTIMLTHASFGLFINAQDQCYDNICYKIEDGKCMSREECAKLGEKYTWRDELCAKSDDDCGCCFPLPTPEPTKSTSNPTSNPSATPTRNPLEIGTITKKPTNKPIIVSTTPKPTNKPTDSPSQSILYTIIYPSKVLKMSMLTEADLNGFNIYIFYDGPITIQDLEKTKMIDAQDEEQ